MLYAQEIINIVPGKAQEYVQALEREQMPLYQALGYRLVSAWETVASQGYWPEVLTLWEMDDYSHYGEVCRRQHDGGPLMKRYRAWQQRLGELSTGTQGRILVPSSRTQPLTALKRSKFKARICVHETVITTPRKSREYAEQVQRLWQPVAERHGRSMLGVYAVAWRNTEAINIWVLDDWDTIGKHQQALQKDPDGLAWSEIALSLRQDWYDRILVALPFSPV